MKKLCRNVFLSILCLSSSIAIAHQGCDFNPVGRAVCAPPNGGIMKDQRGEPLCGRGQCASDRYGKVLCSSQHGGFAIQDANGLVVCTEKCVPGSADLCQVPR